MPKVVSFFVNENGLLKERTYVALNSWSVHGVELLRHEHFAEMARIAGVQLENIRCDYCNPTSDNGLNVCYSVWGYDICGLMKYSVGSATDGNVKGQGAYNAEMAFKRAFDSWVALAVRMRD